MFMNDLFMMAMVLSATASSPGDSNITADSRDVSCRRFAKD
jgi:hypothetical protein